MLYSLLQRAGFKPNLALQSSIPRLLIAAALLGGSGLMLSTGSAQAAAYACASDPAQEGKGGFFTKSFAELNEGDIVTCGDKKYDIGTSNYGGYSGLVNIVWVEGLASGYQDDDFLLNLAFFTPVVGPKTGFFNYKLSILDSNYTFDSVQLDTTVTVPKPPVPSINYVTVTKKVNGVPILTSINGAQVGPIAFSDPGPITVQDVWTVVPGGKLTFLQDTFTQARDIPPVPGPLPLLGAGAAFGFSRRIRGRIKGARLA
jgi:hypothetical protein